MDGDEDEEREREGEGRRRRRESVPKPLNKIKALLQTHLISIVELISSSSSAHEGSGKPEWSLTRLWLPAYHLIRLLTWITKAAAFSKSILMLLSTTPVINEVCESNQHE